MKKTARAMGILVVILALLTGCSRGIVETTQFTFGLDARETQPTTIDEFIPIVAEQVRIYNEVATDVWPNSSVTNMRVMIHDVDTAEIWLIEPDGTTSTLTTSEAEEMGAILFEFPGIFDFFGDAFYQRDEQGRIFGFSLEGRNVGDGMAYFSVSKEELNDRALWDRWSHASTYDLMRILVHKAFHSFEQSTWAGSEAMFLDLTTNPEEQADVGQFLEVTGARLLRDMLHHQLFEAVANPDDESYILDALATYRAYKEQYPEDFQAAILFDRLEGTAKYHEIISSLFMFFPEQIENRDDLDNALTQLATESGYMSHDNFGLVSEAYLIGAFSGILLTRLGVEWQEQIIQDENLTPLEILYRHYENTELPEPRQHTPEELDAAMENLDRQIAHVRGVLEDFLNQMEMMLEFVEDDDERQYVEERIAETQNQLERLN